MARYRLVSPSSLLAFTCAVLVLLSMLPVRRTRWLGAFRGPLMVVVAPVASPLAAAGRWMRGGELGRTSANDPRLAELQRQANSFRTLYFKALQENNQLRGMVRALQSGISAAQSPGTRFLEARSFGSSPAAGTIEVSRGTADSVVIGAVATAVSAPQHLVGIVTAVGPKTATVHLITDPHQAPGLIEALLVPDAPVELPQVASAPHGQFRAQGDGTLIADLGLDEAARVSPGDLAFVDDPQWPPAAQRLILGRVIAVHDAPEQPLFRMVVIRPDIDVARVSGVLLRLASHTNLGANQ